jgi:hypothetical protein
LYCKFLSELFTFIKRNPRKMFYVSSPSAVDLNNNILLYEL